MSWDAKDLALLKKLWAAVQTTECRPDRASSAKLLRMGLQRGHRTTRPGGRTYLSRAGARSNPGPHFFKAHDLVKRIALSDRIPNRTIARECGLDPLVRRTLTHRFRNDRHDGH
jgi:hypothetical protein